MTDEQFVGICSNIYLAAFIVGAGIGASLYALIPLAALVIICEFSLQKYHKP